MKTALIAGSSGLIGQHLLKELLASEQYAKVISLVRREQDLNHPKLEQRIIDFENLSATDLKADHVFCTLGTTIKKAGSKEAFRKVDEEYPLSIATQAQKQGAQLFAIVTAMGSNPDSFFFYNQVKGELEQALKKLNYTHLGVFKPSMLMGDREESRLGESVGQAVMSAVKFLLPANTKPIEGKKVAKAMIQYAKSPKTGLSEILSGEMQ
ncbi:MAG: oxidoreductase [Cytophagales bacterium]|nr:oxidoreductase [Cytophagales bacterium]